MADEAELSLQDAGEIVDAERLLQHGAIGVSRRDS